MVWLAPTPQENLTVRLLLTFSRSIASLLLHPRPAALPHSSADEWHSWAIGTTRFARFRHRGRRTLARDIAEGQRQLRVRCSVGLARLAQFDRMPEGAGAGRAGVFFGRYADIMAALTESAWCAAGARRGFWLSRRPRAPASRRSCGLGFGRGSSAIRISPHWRFCGPPRASCGPDGIGRRIATWFERHGVTRPPGTIHSSLTVEDSGKAASALAALVTEATAFATAARRAGAPDARAPAALLAIDQGEELFAAENDGESRRVLELLAAVLAEPPEGTDRYVFVTISADSAQSLLARVSELGLETPKAIYLPPLSPAAYREVVLRPAEVYTARARRLAIEPALAKALAADATGTDALPLLAFTLSRLFADYHAEGELKHQHYRDMGGIAGSVRRALTDAQARAGAAGSDAHLRRLILPRLATWDPDAGQGKGAAKRLVATRADILGGERAALKPLADALVEARLLSVGRDTLEVAHEALLRLPPIADWLEEDREFLVWRERLSRARAVYEANARGLLVGRELKIARDWRAGSREPRDIAAADLAIIEASEAEDEKRCAEEDARER
jgi:hypothetical protein